MRRITPARVVTCNPFASRARNPGASSWRSKMLWLTTTIVSMPAWADRRTGGPAESRSSAMPTARPPDRLAAALFDRVNALVQRVRDVPGGVIPLRKVQRRVYPAGDLAQTTRGEQEGAANRVRLERATQAGHGRGREDARGRCAERVRRVLLEVTRAPEVQAERQRVLVPFADRRVEVVAREDDVAPAAGRVDAQPGDRQQRVGLGEHAPVPFPAPEALLAERVAGAGGWIASRKQEQIGRASCRERG